jgi:vitamin B12 transporter
MYKAIALLCCLLFTNLLCSQKVHQDTVLLQSTEVIANNKLSCGTQVLRIDSIALSQNKHASLSGLLQSQTALYVKQYGNQQLNTISIRGGSASQTQIFWCGFNINNAMLGQQDLSIVPVNSIRNAQLVLGSASTAYGSGAIGGVVSINENKVVGAQKKELDLNLSLGSYGQKNISGSFIYQWKNISTQFSSYYHASKNDFRYINRLNPELGELRMAHNQQLYYGLSGQAQFKMNERDFIHFNIWLQEQKRNIAATLLQDTSIAQQRDAFIKNNISYTHFFHKGKLNLNTALMRDILNYQNGFESNSTILSFMNSALYEVSIGPNVTWQSKIQFNHIKADFKNYDQGEGQLLQYQFSTHFSKTWKEILSTSLALRYEIQNNNQTPLVFQVGNELNIHKNLSLKSNIGNFFRWPTLNDLYWKEGGNPNLKPERGWQAELGLSYHLKVNTFSTELSSAAFYRNVRDWIMWVPVTNFWSPENIAKVESKGLENKISSRYKLNDFTLSIKCHYDHILSVNKKKRFDSDAIYNKQLIYTPIQQMLTEFGIDYKKTSLILNRKYNGFRYTSADNSAYIDGFWISNISVIQNVKLKATEFSISAQINNLENKNFEYIAFYPSMGRNYQLTLTIKIK